MAIDSSNEPRPAASSSVGPSTESYLSPHFRQRELACPCCGRAEVTAELVAALEALRALSGRPILIHSGFRCAAHNAAIGGEPHSYHCRGMAADIGIATLSGRQIVELARQLPAFHGFGAAPEWAHVDVRPTEHIALWSYGPRREIGPFTV